MRPRCLITGCSLVATNTGATAHGDLHQVGDTFVFNAVLNQFEAKWSYDSPQTNLRVYVDTEHAFERRGVIVFAAADARLSVQAQAYVKGAP